MPAVSSAHETQHIAHSTQHTAHNKRHYTVGPMIISTMPVW